MRGFGKQANQKVEADKIDRSAPAKKVISGNDLRVGKGK